MFRYNKQADEQANLLQIIRDIRIDHPTMCCRYMYYKINPVHIGRDRFEALCRANGFMVTKKRSRKTTTDSRGVKRFDNLLENKQLTDVDQAWSSDITYFEIENVFYYITFIMDEYSRKILGHYVSSRLLTEQTSLPALRRAIRSRHGDIPEGVIFHSDGGGQYYDQKFLGLTARNKMKNSMCEFAYQNGKAERINGVIKNNYLKYWQIESLSQLTKSVDRAVKLYNEGKPHSSLDLLTPNEFEKIYCNVLA
jgi:transposase InsO family protein